MASVKGETKVRVIEETKVRQMLQRLRVVSSAPVEENAKRAIERAD
jgi:hypothetical protein